VPQPPGTLSRNVMGLLLPVQKSIICSEDKEQNTAVISIFGIKLKEPAAQQII
jgi:hypothetical protein